MHPQTDGLLITKFSILVHNVLPMQLGSIAIDQSSYELKNFLVVYLPISFY